MKISKPQLNKLILIALITLGIISGILAFHSWQTDNRLKNTQAVVEGVKLDIKSEEVETSNKVAPPTSLTSTKSTSTPKPTSIPAPLQSSSSTGQVSNSPAPTQTSTTAFEQINLSINGSSSFNVTVSKDSNQCDVLSKALEQGKISSLNMRYDKTYETYAVYQINGMGKENSVWWVYTVNDQSPSQGCSYIKTNSGDNIEWKYIGS